MIQEWNESRIKTKEEVLLQQEKEAWKNLMKAIGDMGTLTIEQSTRFYKHYHKYWNVLMDRARIYQRAAKLNEKYGLDEEI